MGPKHADKFLNVMKYFMMLSGQWDFRNEKSKFVPVYEKLKYVFFIWYALGPFVFLVTVIAGWKCREIVEENLFNFMYTSVVVIVVCMLNSNDTKNIVNYVFHFENNQLNSSSKECQDLYAKAAKKNNVMVIGFYAVGLIACIVWFTAGKR